MSKKPRPNRRTVELEQTAKPIESIGGICEDSHVIVSRTG